MGSSRVRGGGIIFFSLEEDTTNRGLGAYPLYAPLAVPGSQEGEQGEFPAPPLFLHNFKGFQIRIPLVVHLEYFGSHHDRFVFGKGIQYRRFVFFHPHLV